MSQNEEKINQFMEALGEIDPKYVEEARQAVLPGNTPKHSFSVASLLASIRRWIHSPAVRLVTAACLVLVLVYGVQKAGILSSFSPFGASGGGVDSSKFNSGDTSDSNRTGSINQESGEDSQAAGENKKGNDNGIEEAAEDKTTSTEPPVLTLHASDETLRSDSGHESTSFINIQSDEYSWSCSQKDGSNSSSFGHGTDIWNFASLPVFSTVSGNELTPDFNGIEPDSLSIRYIPSSEVKKADREERYQKITLKEDGSFQLPETENSYIVEIQAVWDNDTYEGDCTYRFKINIR